MRIRWGGARMRIWGKGLCSDAACRIAIRCRVVIKIGVLWVAWYTYMAMGGGIFALRSD